MEGPVADEISRKLDDLMAGQTEVLSRLGRVEAELRDVRRGLDLHYTSTTAWRRGVNDHLELIAEHLGAAPPRQKVSF